MFTGFGPDAVEFLAGLDADNSTAYFHEHRPVYDEQVRPPLKDLCVAIGDRLADTVAPDLSYEPRIGASMFRINRDRRFAPDADPYHPHLDLTWWEGRSPRTGAAFILRIRHDEVLTGAGIYRLTGTQLDRFRHAVAGDAGAELDAILGRLMSAVPEASVSEPTRKRVPRGFDPDHERADHLRRDGLHARAVEATPPEITSADFVSWVSDRLVRFAAVHRWLVDHAPDPKGG